MLEPFPLRKRSSVLTLSVFSFFEAEGFQDRGNMKLWKSAVFVVLFTLLVRGAWSQDQPQPRSNSKSVDNLGLQVEDQNHDQSQTAPAQTPAGEAARATHETTVSPKEAKELFKSVDEIVQFASQDTGLPVKHEVKRRLAKRDEVQSYIEKNLKEDKDGKRVERAWAVLKKVGLLPRNFDLSKFLVTMLREQVAGYYDPKTKTVNLLNWLDVEQQKPVLAHELTHALQDQSFDIEKWMKGSPDSPDNKRNDPSPGDIENDEESAARQAVVEGQAMVVLLDYSLAPTGKTLQESPQIVDALKQGMLTGTADSPAFRDAPIFLKETLTFPYRYGLDFTSPLLKTGGKELSHSRP